MFWATANLSVSVDLPDLGISHTWDHTTGVTYFVTGVFP